MSELEDEFLFHCKAAGLPEPVREYKFAAALNGRRWRADFAWLEIYPVVLVEIEGGTHKESRHTREPGFSDDCRKYNFCACAGYRLLRFSADMVRSGEALALCEEVLRGQRALPAPQPYQRSALI